MEIQTAHDAQPGCPPFPTAGHSRGRVLVYTLDNLAAVYLEANTRLDEQPCVEHKPVAGRPRGGRRSQHHRPTRQVQQEVCGYWRWQKGRGGGGVDAGRQGGRVARSTRRQQGVGCQESQEERWQEEIDSSVRFLNIYFATTQCLSCFFIAVHAFNTLRQLHYILIVFSLSQTV